MTDQVIWTGSNNGLIYVTQDGGNTWKETDLKLPYNANVVIMDASHSDPAEAYAAVDLHAAGDYTPTFTARAITAPIGTSSPTDCRRTNPQAALRGWYARTR